MGYSYDIRTSKKDILSSTSLLACHKISSIINLFLSTFLVAYIYTFSGGLHEYIFNVALYEISTYITLTICLFLLCVLIEKTNRIWFFRIGLIARAGLVVFAIFFGENLAHLIPLAGFLNGLSQAFYYASYNTMKHEMVSRKSISSFLMFDQIIGKVMDIIVPIVLGALIEVSTYMQVSIYIFVVCVIQIGISFGVKSKRPQGSSFSLKQYFSVLNKKPVLKKKMKFVYGMAFVYGMTTIVPTLVNICIMMEFGSSFKLGVVTSVCAVVAIVAIFLFKRFTKMGNRTMILCLISVVPLLSTILFAIFPGIATLIVYNIAVVACKVVYQYLFEVHRFSTLKEEGLYEFITEHQALVEVMFGVSRIATFALMFLFNMGAGLVAFKVFLCVMSVSFSLILLLLMCYEVRYFSKRKEEFDDKNTFNIIKKCLKKSII